MSTRSVIVRLEAQVGQYVAGLGRAATETDNLAKKAAQARKSVGDNSQAMDRAGSIAAGFGAATVAGLGLATKAAIDWESAWAGVTKTVNGTPQQMAAIEESLRGLAKELPATHQEIAAVAEAAGALGVAREDIVGFTRTMINLGETTNLTSDEAATSIAQIANVTGLLEREGAAGVAKFGSALVALGNDGASTEAEILSMAQRIAGAGVQIGLAEGEILGVASALSSVGIEAEAGGSAISTVMINIAAAVDQGGADLEKWASAAGMSGAEFKKAFEDDAAGALVALVDGLGNASETGQTTLGMLEELGITEIRTRDAMLRLAASGDLLADSLQTGNRAFEENTALAEEAAKRYETTEAKVQIAWNNIKDAAIDAGAVLLPVVETIAEGAVGIADAFGSIPEPMQGFITVAGLVVGASALVGGGLLKVIPQIADARQAFRDLDASGSKIPGTLGKVGKAAGIAAVAYGALTTAAGLAAAASEEARRKTSPEQFINALSGIESGADGAAEAVDRVFNGVNQTGNESFTAVNDLESAINRVFNPQVNDNISDFFNTAFGQNATSGINVAKNALGDLDTAIASLYTSGNTSGAADAFELVKSKAEELEVPVTELVELFPQYRDAINAAATQNGATQLTQEELIAAMEGTSPVVQEAAEAMEAEGAAAEQAAAVSEEMAEALAEIGLSADGTIVNLNLFTEALLNAGLIQLSANDAARGFEAAIDDVDAKIAGIIETYGSLNGILNENADGFNRDTAAGRDAEAAFDAVASSGARLTQALAENGGTQEELQGSLRGTYDSLITAAGQFGITGGQADYLARQVMGIPEEANIDTWMSDAARQKAEETIGAVERLDGKTATVTTVMKEITERQVIDLGTSAPGTVVRPGQVGRHASGGRLPSTGPGTDRTDGILGVSQLSGQPISWLDGGEWVINSKSSDKYDRVLSMINRDDPRLSMVSGLAGGGRVSRQYPSYSGGHAYAGPSVVERRVYVPIQYTGPDINTLAEAVARRIS